MARLSLALLVLLATTLGDGAPPPPARAADPACSYLCTQALGREGQPSLRLQTYTPREGDILLYSDDSVLWRCLFALARTGPPYHAGIVTRLPDGRPALLEAGPYDCMSVYLMDVLPRLHSHNGTVWVRRLRTPLCPDQSARLTSFALAQTNKRFALGRVALQLTPFKARGPVRSHLFGNPRLDQRRWFCSQLVVAAAGAAGLLDLKAIPPNSVYPRDLFVDSPYDLRPLWEPPARWTAGLVPPGSTRRLAWRWPGEPPG
jgi:hypothetical protein